MNTRRTAGGCDTAIAIELRAKRARHRGLTIERLAASSGVPKRTLVRSLDDERDVRLDHLALVCQALEVRVSHVVRHVEERIDIHDKDC